MPPSPVEWKISDHPVDFPDAMAQMEQRVDQILAGNTPEQVWLLEHPPLYTAGTSAKPADLVEARFPVYETGRGGQYTYHGPGQRVGYVMLDLKRRNPDVREFVKSLEQWLIGSLAQFGVKGELREGRIGIWVVRPDGSEAKIAALGIRLKQWVSFHGVALNVSPDLSHFSGIVPCGIRDYGVTSLAELGVNVSMQEVDHILCQEFDKQFSSSVIPAQAGIHVAEAEGNSENR